MDDSWQLNFLANFLLDWRVHYLPRDNESAVTFSGVLSERSRPDLGHLPGLPCTYFGFDTRNRSQGEGSKFHRNLLNSRARFCRRAGIQQQAGVKPAYPLLTVNCLPCLTSRFLSRSRLRLFATQKSATARAGKFTVRAPELLAHPV